MHEDITSTLNEPQKEAVLHQSGPLLILAGAGSGKTRALTHRIARLIAEGVPPWQILAVTFTNKAATEMKERIKNMLHISEGEDLSNLGNKTGKLPVMGTFHSICARILRRDIEHLGRDRSFVIYDSDDQERLMKEVLKEMHIPKEELKPKAVLGHISRFKSEALSPKEAEAQAGTDRMKQIITAYKRYQHALLQANALDFDDLILETVRLFHEVPAVLDKYQETWRYLHVDEYQDTNHVQYLFITLLAQKYQNLCVIGDPDQSIYAFRGADIRNILEFQKDYKGAKSIKLEQNYRSTQPILDAADAVISHNPNRPEKKMWTEQKDGAQIVVHELRDERAEAAEAIRSAEQMQKDGVKLNDQVILYRTNAQSRLFEEACMRAGVPYRIIGGVKFYARKEVKDVLAYLHAILNPNDTIALLRILNVPSRKIGQTSVEKLQAFGSQQSFNVWQTLCQVQQIDELGDAASQRIAHFVEMMKEFREDAEKMVVSDLTKRVLHKVGMEQWLRDDTEEGEARWQNVLELLSVMHKYDTLPPHDSLMSFLEEVSLVSEVDNVGKGDDALTLMTLHLCKGLEFDHVMIGGCEEGIFPHSNCMFDKEQLEEERRIMYVGMTRARKHLRIFCARNRMLWGETSSNAPSRFLEDLPDNVTERRSDELLSAFAWAAGSGKQRAYQNEMKSAGRKQLEEKAVDLDFNQDFEFNDDNQDLYTEGARVEHPVFGQGTVTARRGDIADILFDTGQKKSLALSIAPLKPL